jgi:hypothetical protein
MFHLSDVYPLDVNGISGPRNGFLSPECEWLIAPETALSDTADPSL